MLIVTGATGFLGEFVVRELYKERYPFKCLVRRSSNIETLQELGVNTVYGDLDDLESLLQAFQGSRVLVNLASLGFGHAPNILEAAKKSEITRGIFISTTSIFTTLEPESKKIRLDAEKRISESALSYTILRPTMIYGTGKDRNICKLVRFVNKYPLVPVFGNGKMLMQPIFVEDLAKAVVDVVKSEEKTSSKKYNVAGKEPFSYNEILDKVATVLGKEIKKMHLPPGMVLPLLRLYNKISSRPYFTVEQVLRLQEDKAFSYQEAFNDFSFSPRSFEEGIKLEVEDMRRRGML